MTLEERERRAYISGNVREADLLGAIADAEFEQVDELDHEVRQLKARVEELENELTDKDDEIANLEAEPRCICA